jgi:hypothetical protein
MITNTSNYKGPHLAIEMDRVMSSTLRKIKKWPEYDLFDFFPK